MIQTLLTADGSLTLLLPDLDETYHSRHGAVREAKRVFIDEGLAVAHKRIHETLNVLEIGFGTGLNTLLSYQYACANECRVNYVALETNPVSMSLINSLDYPHQTNHPKDKDAFLRMHDVPVHYSAEIGAHFILEKHLSDIRNYNSEERFDLVFYDVFSPRSQPELWSVDTLKEVRRLIKPNGILISHFVQHSVQSALNHAGFIIDDFSKDLSSKPMLRCSLT